MNNQQKSPKTEQNLSVLPVTGEVVAGENSPKRGRGRPKTSPHDTATQNRLRVQRHRDAKREDDAVRVDLYLPRAWHDWLVDTKGANLREVGVEAFALWLQRAGYPAEPTGSHSPPMAS